MGSAFDNSPLLFDLSAGPDYSAEQRLIDRGIGSVCGVDEVGRGPLAGPVVTAAVILDASQIPDGLQDSKKLTANRRDTLYGQILEAAIAVSVSSINATMIDSMNIRAASLAAMTRAVNGLSPRPGFALVDGNAFPDGMVCQASALVKGDGRSVSIAAASIVAKVVRDKMMVLAARQYPHYGFESHKGYGTAAHLSALNAHGPCRLHRHSFAPVRAAAEEQKGPSDDLTGPEFALD